MNLATLSPLDLARISAGHCPACGYRGFVLGPRGGAAINIECGNVVCGERFNVASAPGSHHVVMGQRIPKLGAGGTKWD